MLLTSAGNGSLVTRLTRLVVQFDAGAFVEQLQFLEAGGRFLQVELEGGLIRLRRVLVWRLLRRQNGS